MSETVIKLDKISKKYFLLHEKPTLVEDFMSIKKTEAFWSLKNINLLIKKGESVGIIGTNGSGKTTLLKIVAGITTPTSGKVITYGKIASLIELEAGFHPDLTGEENIYLNGLLIGMSKKSIKLKFKQIVKFSELDNFIDSPIYTYSEGMKLKLGFSIMAHSESDILLLDENMAIGDKLFIEKSLAKIQEFIKQQRTLLIVSHWVQFLNKSCNRIIWLEKGRILRDGKPGNIIDAYQNNYYL